MRIKPRLKAKYYQKRQSFQIPSTPLTKEQIEDLALEFAKRAEKWREWLQQQEWYQQYLNERKDRY